MIIRPPRVARLFAICALLATTTSQAAPSAITAIEPAVVTVGKPHAVTIRHRPLAESEQLFFQPGGPYVRQRLDLAGRPADLATGGGRVYAVGDFDGIEILAPAGGGHLKKAGRFAGGQRYRAIRFLDGRILALAERRLDVFSLDGEGEPHLQGGLDSPGPLRALAAEGETVVLLKEDGKLLLLDLASPGAPRIVDTLDPQFPIRALRISQGLLYLAADDEGLLAMDLRPGARGQVIGRYRTTGPALHVRLHGSLALVANGAQGLTVLDVSDPARMTWVGSHQQLGAVRRVEILDAERAAALNGEGDVLLVDLGNPAMPALISVLPRGGALAALPLNGDLILATTRGLQVLDTRALPPQISNEGLDSGQGVNYGGERKLVIEDGIAYVADWFSGIHLYDIGDPRRPRLLSSFHTQGSPKGVVVRDGVAYVADDDHGLQIIDVRDPRRPRQLSSLLTSGLAYTPVLAGDLLYLASHRGGFQIVDVKDPARPALVADVDTPGKSWSIQVRGDYAYVADDDPGLLVFDIRDPAAPRFVAQFNPGGAAEDVLLDGDLAYVAFFDRGVYVLDISDPRHPRELHHVPTPGNARGLERDGRYLYVADWLGGIQVVDVARPEAAAITGSFDTAGASWGLRVHEGFAYVADWWGGFIVLDVRDPQRPRLAGSYHHNDDVKQVATRGMYAFVAKGRDGLQVFDINNALNPTWVTGVATGPAEDIVIAGRFAATCGGAEISIVDIADPFRPVLMKKVALDHDCELLRGGDHAVYAAQRNGAITRLGLDDGTFPVTRGEGPALADLWADGGDLFVLGADGTVRRHDDTPGDPRAMFTLTGGSAASLRAAGRTVAIHQPGKGIALLQREGGKLTGNGFIPLTAPLADLRLADGRLFVATGDNAILTFALGGRGGWRLETRYPALNPVSRIHPKGNTVYGAGARHITAVAIPPPVPLTPRGATETRADLPGEMPNGAYDVVLTALDKDAPPFVAHNGLTIEMPAFGKPSFTMEDLKRVMEQRRKAQQKGP